MGENGEKVALTVEDFLRPPQKNKSAYNHFVAAKV
jgi:hypothetical protein